MQSKREFDYKKDENSLRVVSHFIGNTPFVKLSDKLYAKLESVNPGGSIKDRPVKWILDDAEEKGLISSGDVIIEATSGNTGIALAMIGAERGYPVKIVMPDDMSIERKSLLRLYGAELIEVKSGDFEQREGGAVYLSESGRKIVIAEYQRRKQDDTKHPLLKQKVSFGLLPHLQARLLARTLRGETEGYLPFLMK